MADDLVQFLRARYGEEQAEAEKQPDDEEAMLDGWEIIATAETNYPGYEYLRIAKKRVLADIDAKRRIIRQAFAHAAAIDGEWGCSHDAEAIEAGACEDTEINSLPLLRLLALPYADHPDYRDEWRP